MSDGEEWFRGIEQRYRILFDECPDAIIVIDPVSNRLLDFNRAAFDLLGYSASDLRGLTMAQIEVAQAPEELAARARRLVTLRSARFETIYRTKSGSSIDVLVTAQLIDLEHRQIQKTVMRDITTQKETERRLRDSEVHLRQLTDSCFGFIGLFDLEGKLIEANRAPLEAGGMRREDVIGKRFVEIDFWSHSAEAREQLRNAMRRAAQGETVRYETTGLIAGEQVIDVDISFGPIRNAEGEIVNIAGFGVDVTERKRIVELLHESEARYRGYVDYAPCGVFAADENNQFIDVNPAGCRITGYEKSDLLRMKISDILPTEYLGAGVSQVAEQREKKAIFGELPFLHKSGEWRWWSVAGAELSGNRVLGFVTDVTDRKRTEQALQESEERFRAIFEQAAVGVAEVDTATARFLRVNRKCCEILGYTQAEMLELDCVQVTHPDDRELHMVFLDQLRRGVFREFTTEKRIVRCDGATPWVNLTVSPMWPPGSSPTHHIAVIEDITGRKLAEDNQRTHSQVLLSMREAVSVTDGQGMIRFTNRALDSMFGYAAGELIGERVTILNDATPEENGHIETEIRGAIATDGVWSGEFRNRRKDGSVFWTEAHISQTNVSGVNSFVSIQQDVSARRHAEDQMRILHDQLAHVARLATMGEMASGLAHELNQPLCALEMYSQTALRIDPVNRPEELRKCLQRLSEQSLRAGEIVRNMRSFVGRRTPCRSPANVNQLIRDILPILANEQRQNSIQLNLKLEETLPPVLIDGVQIQQVLVNLIRNAIEAMGQRAQGVRLLSIHTSEVPDGICVSVTDTGPGILPSIADKLFHPFETTKSSGLGLGLAISKSLVDAHGGRISVLPNPGGGTIFSLIIPRSERVTPE